MRNLNIILLLCMLLCVVVAASACSHQHEVSNDWNSDDNNHWHSCTDVNCDEKFDSSAHQFDNGYLSSAGTEGVDSVITYTCKKCGYQKDETVHAHKYESEWTITETHHWHTSTCGHDNKDMGEHMFDDGFVLTPATEDTEGVMLYTCAFCHYEKTEAIAPLSHKHTYDETNWAYDADYHWHATTCEHNLKKDKDAHTYGEGVKTKDPTEFEEGITSYKCETCDYVKEEPIDKLPHTHTFETEWSKDTEHHWYASACNHNETVTRFAHEWDDGEVTIAPTNDTEGVRTFTCTECGQTKTAVIPTLSHTHTFEPDYTKDVTHHWYVPTCGHDDALEKVAHSFDANGNCVCGYHATCQTCGKCESKTCTTHTDKCLFADKSYVVHFAPQGVILGNPESGNATYSSGISAGQVVLDDGTKATYVKITSDVDANGGVSFTNNDGFTEAGLAGFNPTIPHYQNKTKVIRMHFVNTGNVDVTFKYSQIDFGVDYGVVEMTLKAGESATVLMTTVYNKNTISLNAQIAFPEGAPEGASLAIWGEFYADGLDGNISIVQAAKTLTYKVGDTFSTEGLVIQGKSSVNAYGMSTWARVYIAENYVTNYDGHVFTEEDVGTKTVTVSFAGKTTTYTITVVK